MAQQRARHQSDYVEWKRQGSLRLCHVMNGLPFAHDGARKA